MAAVVSVSPSVGTSSPLPPAPFAAGTPTLDAAQVRARLAQYGPNDVARVERAGALRHFLRGLASPLILILLAASVVAASVGEIVDAAIIAATVLLSAALDAFQTTRSSAAVERLRNSVIPTATVWREGAWHELSRRDIVPGDVIHLSAGDVVPADARLITSRDLHVQQAALTGESLPAEKEARATGDATAVDGPLTDPNRSDAVFLGTSIVSGAAVAIVVATGASTAFGEIAARLRDAPPPTEFERGLRRFGVLLAETVVFLVLFLVLVSVGLHRDPLQSLLFAVALAVGLVPEFMPMVTSITLATGAIRMSRHRVIVKHLAAIQNFGGIDMLCSDKTGTLTQGDMRLAAAVGPDGQPDAGVRELATVSASLQTGIRNPLDDAILASATADPAWEKVDEIPFDFERRRMSVIVRRGNERILIVKGAPETVLAACTTARAGGEVTVLDQPARDAIAGRIHAAGVDGYRTIAIATRDADPSHVYSRDDECELTLAGWLTFADPPLADAAAMVAALREDGVELKVLTGDDEAVAHCVCSSAGVDSSTIVLGSELDRTSDAALGALAERTSVFARLSPQQKLRVILALKARGHVVGYIGDGINDAPSLHAADVGIAAPGAVDVARDAADIVLLDRGLGVLHKGIVEGRKAFGNVMKYLLMGTSSNFGNMFSMAIASLMVPFLPMLPTQILLNNFLYDFAQVAIPSDRVDDAYLRKPHRWNMPLLRTFMIRIGLVSSVFDLLTFGVLLVLLRSTPAVFRTGWFIESIVTQTLVLFVIRTSDNPLRSRPSGLLVATVLSAMIIGVALPYTPLRHVLGFASPPPVFLLFVVVATMAYLGVVELAKRRLLPRLLA